MYRRSQIEKRETTAAVAGQESLPCSASWTLYSSLEAHASFRVAKYSTLETRSRLKFGTQ